MMINCRLSVRVQLVGLHDINNREDVRNCGNVKLLRGSKLRFDRNPSYMQTDINAVNVYAVDGRWKNKHIGHVATHRTVPVCNQYHGHFISALMDADIDRTGASRLPAILADVPGGINQLLSFDGETFENTSHTAIGSQITMFVHFADGASEEIVDAVQSLMRKVRVSLHCEEQWIT